MTRYDIKILGWIGLLLCPAAFAATPALETHEDRWYQVELILFKHLDDQDPKESEQWPDLTGAKLPADVLELSEIPPPPPATESAEALPATPSPAPVWQATSGTQTEAPGTEAPLPVAYEILPAEEYQLQSVYGSLKRSSRYRPLLHLAWRQITVGDEDTKPVLLYSGMTDALPVELYYPEAAAPGTEPGNENVAAATTEQDNMTTATGSTDELSAPPLLPATEEDTKIGPESPELLGTVRLSVARYLHLEADLIYRIPVAQAIAKPINDLDLWYERPYATLHDPQGPAYSLETWQAIQGFRMFESRRMRSKELHYLDNPFFGMVVLVTPYEPALTKEQQETPATQLRTLD